MNIEKKKTVQYIKGCVGLLPIHLDSQVKTHIEELVRGKYGDKVCQYGYVYGKTIRNITYTSPRISGSHFNGHLNVNVAFEADTYLPEINEIVIAPVTSVSRIITILKDFPLNINVYNTSGTMSQQQSDGTEAPKAINYDKIRVGQYRQVKIKAFELKFETAIECYGEIVSEAIDKPTLTMLEVLPKINLKDLTYVHAKKEDIKPSAILGSNENLSKHKDMIDQYVASKDKSNLHKKGKDLWDVLNGVLHKYDFINVSRRSAVKKTQAEFKTVNEQFISRAYFKLWEILKTKETGLEDFLLKLKNTGITCGSIAEGPGGFIKSLCDFCELNGVSINNYYATTLKQELDVTKGETVADVKHIWWSNTIENVDFKKKYNMNLSYGDLYDPKTYEEFIDSLNGEKCDIVTADGGIDVSSDYNNQELLNLRLFAFEILFALAIQKEGGTFIMKIYDVFYESTLQLLQIASQYYTDACIFKPHTSKLANSEKYLILKGFKGITEYNPEDPDALVEINYLYSLCYNWPLSDNSSFIYSFLNNITGYSVIEKSSIDKLIAFNKYLEDQIVNQLEYIKLIYIEEDPSKTNKNISELLQQNMKSSVLLLEDLGIEAQPDTQTAVAEVYKQYSGVVNSIKQ